MQKLFFISILFITTLSFAQVGIGKVAVDGKGILDFGTDNNKGIILPIVEASGSSIYTNGCFLMDKNDLKVKVYQDGTWLELSDAGSLAVQYNESSNPISTAAVLNSSEEEGSGVIIGDVNASGNPVSGALGVLILEANDKALILPKVSNPHLNIKSPVAGTICYDVVSNSLSVFDGKVWNYWK